MSALKKKNFQLCPSLPRAPRKNQVCGSLDGARRAPEGIVAGYPLSETGGEAWGGVGKSSVSRGNWSIIVATQGMDWCGARAPGGVGRRHSLTACLCLALVPSPALPRSLSHWEMSRVSHHC